jgi:copper chaperone
MPRVTPEKTQRLRVDGMTCPACKAKVEQTLRGLAGVEGVEVDLDRGIAEVAGEVEPEDLINALSYTDYQARPLNEHGPL